MADEKKISYAQLREAEKKQNEREAAIKARAEQVKAGVLGELRARADGRVQFAHLVAKVLLERGSIDAVIEKPQDFARDVFDIADALSVENQRRGLQQYVTTCETHSLDLAPHVRAIAEELALEVKPESGPKLVTG